MENTYTAKMAHEGAQDGDEGVTDQYIIKHYNLNPKLRGKQLDAAAEMTQKQMNQDYLNSN